MNAKDLQLKARLTAEARVAIDAGIADGRFAASDRAALMATAEAAPGQIAGKAKLAGQRRDERDRIVRAACAEGRFGESRIGHYAALYDRDPQGTRALLTADEKDGGLARVRAVAAQVAPGAAGLTSSDAVLLAASRARMGGDDIASRAEAVRTASLSGDVPSGEGIPQTPDGLGLGTVDPPQASSSEPPVVGPSGIAVDASGRLSYQGLPVSLASDGTPRVHVSAGAMTIDTLRSLGVDLDFERTLHASRTRMGSAA